MKLRRVCIREFKSIWNSTWFELGATTCLVGKNEAGKTSLLQALHRLNPLDGDGTFDVTDDYPRAYVEDYRDEITNGGRQPARVVEAVFELESEESTLILEEYGKGVVEPAEVVLTRGYPAETGGDSTLYVTVSINEPALIENLIRKFEIPSSKAKELKTTDTLAALETLLSEMLITRKNEADKARADAEEISDESDKATALEAAESLEEDSDSERLREYLATIPKGAELGLHIWSTILKPFFPKFLYFDDYYQLTGADNLQKLKERKEAGKLLPSDRPLLGLIDLARLDLDKLLTTTRTQELKNTLQGASNHLTRKILTYWSQNKHLQMTFDVRAGLADDPEGMTAGLNIWGEVYDAKRLVSTALVSRSKGFVWFFSFLAWYSAEKKKNQPLVLLLDEPGLSLHGKAQDDLLRYFEKEIVSNPNHQLIYTTHSPFMVDPHHFDRVRIVQDKGIDTDDELSREEDGTKVFTDVLEAAPDSLFPLQGALGYELYQSLFVGPNCLIVEGVSDLMYLQTLSAVLESKGRTGLNSHWTITPVGGSDKVSTFVALLGAQSKVNVATLIDFQKGDQQTQENLYKTRLIQKKSLLTYAMFTETLEADVEDMFDAKFYLQLVNGEFGSSLQKKLKPQDLKSKAPRINVRLEQYFTNFPMKGGSRFNHYRPARYLTEISASLTIPKATLDRFEGAFKVLNALLK